MKNKLCTFSFSVLCLSCFTQQNWAVSIAGENHDDAHQIITTSDNTFLIAGETWSKNYFTGHQGRSDALLMMLNASGELLWQKTFGAADEDVVKSVCEMRDGNFVAVGMSECIPGPGGDCSRDFHTPNAWAICVDKSGYLLWSKDLAVAGIAESVVCLPDGSVSIAIGNGLTASIINLNNNGRTNWSTSVVCENPSHLHNIVCDAAGNHYLLGSAHHIQNVGQPGQECGTNTFISHHRIIDLWLKKFDADGNEIWCIALGNKGNNLSGKMSVALNGDLLIPISSESTGEFGCGKAYDFTVVRISPDGEHVLDNCFGSENIEQPKSLAALPDGSVWMLGDLVKYSDLEFGPGYQREVWLQQTNAAGELTDVVNTYNTTDVLTTSIATLPGRVVMLSNVQVKTPVGFQDDVIIKSYKTKDAALPDRFISEMDLIAEEADHRSEESVSVEELGGGSLSVYPNPANSSLVVESNETISRIRITDAAGRVVINSRCAGVGRCELDVSLLAAGQYFVDVKTDNYRTVKPLIKN